MLSLIFWLKVKRRDARRAADALRAILQPAQVDRSCARCGLLNSSEVCGEFVYFEEWSSENALRERIRSTDFAHLLSLLETAAEPPVLEIRTIGEIRGLGYVRELRLESAATAPITPNASYEGDGI